MNNIFSSENKFFRIVTKIIHMIFVSFLWLLCCIPVFTIGASTSALYYTVERNIKHDLGYPAQMFFRSFRRSFRQSTIVWLVLFGLFLILTFDWTFFTNYGNDGHPAFLSLRYIIAVMIGIELVCFLYVFPYIARFEIPLRQAVKNSFLLVIRHPRKLILICVFFAFAIFMVWLLPFLIVIVPAVFMWQTSIIMEGIYRIYMTEEDRAREEFLYRIGGPDEL